MEHVFRVIKCQFGYRKVRYRGIAKNGAQAICRELGVSRKVVRKVISVAGRLSFVTSGKISRCRRLAAGERRSISFCQRTRQSHHVSA